MSAKEARARRMAKRQGCYITKRNDGYCLNDEETQAPFQIGAKLDDILWFLNGRQEAA